MSKLSLHAIDQIYKSNSNDPILILLQLIFPNNNKFYFVNNTENITSNGQLYTAFPFSFSLPNDSDEEIPELKITISNVGLDLVDDFTTNTSNILAEVNIVFASMPDFAEISVKNLIVKKVSQSAKFVDIFLGYDDILNFKIPSYTYSAKDFPGLLNV